MKTQIFESYEKFLDREDKTINGVSPDFAKEHPDFAQDNETNNGCWNCSGCSWCSECSECSRCSRCSWCSECSECSWCSRCSGLKGVNKKEESADPVKIPMIPEIHKKIYEAVSQPKALDMKKWHTCETTHCRAGWIVTLAGEQGKKLEQFYNTELAAMMIYDKSGYSINPCRFYDSDDEAMADMERLTNPTSEDGR